MASEVFDEFLEELTTLVGQLERDLVSVDSGRDPSEVVPQTFRVFHTVKGTGGFLGLNHLTGLCHAAEDLLVSIRDGKVAWSREITDLLLHVLDAMRAMMDEFKATEKDGTNAYEPLISGLRAVAQPHGPAAALPQAAVAATAFVGAPPPAPPAALAPAEDPWPTAAPPPPPAPLFQARRAAPRLERPDSAAGADDQPSPPKPAFEPRRASPSLTRQAGPPAGPPASPAPPPQAQRPAPAAPPAAAGKTSRPPPPGPPGRRRRASPARPRRTRRARSQARCASRCRCWTGS